MAYLKISIKTTSAFADTLADALMAVDALSVSLEDAGEQEIFQVEPDDNPLWHEVSVQALFNTEVSPRDVIAQIKQDLALEQPLNYKIEKIADEDWVRLTQKNFKPQCYANKLWVCPSWYEQNQFDGIVVRIDPGLAFGTGTHPTTRLCLKWLTQYDLKDKTIIDYGCGSGILALSALALGAKKVIGVDHDAQALEATLNNAALNDFVTEHNLVVYHSNDFIDINADIVLANILANPLIELEETLKNCCKPGGTLLLSGLLETEQEKVLKAYANDFTLGSVDLDQGWIAIQLFS
ncbi:MAG: 50S ribosomal protein L11 methyltransferase [Gammaproteobacteria bacterium]|nr:50S ribosomal protein L11 methyltransferase [Gammaproteobacteria bacterium]